MVPPILKHRVGGLEARRAGGATAGFPTIARPDTGEWACALRRTPVPSTERGDSFILQATLGCSWNACTYCAMYRGKRYQVRPLDAVLAEISEGSGRSAEEVRHVFVADGDPLGMGLDHWEPILRALAASFPRLRRVSTYATARNLLEKSSEELDRLRKWGLSLLYIGPESGDDVTLRRLAKGASTAEHIEAARKAREAGMEQSLIFLLGAGGRERSEEHARASGRLATAMDPRSSPPSP